jgi:hypothetical protein
LGRNINLPFSADDLLKQQIIGIEQSQFRAVREAVLNLPGAVERLQALDNDIATLRGKLSKPDVS